MKIQDTIERTRQEDTHHYQRWFVNNCLIYFIF